MTVHDLQTGLNLRLPWCGCACGRYPAGAAATDGSEFGMRPADSERVAMSATA